MLSKILSGRDTEKARPAVFATAAERVFTPARPASGAPPEAENAALRERIVRLEAEVIAARNEAFEAGRRQGDSTARRETVPMIEKMAASVAEIVSMRDEVRRRAEKDVVELALLIAKRVLHRELNVDTNALAALARVVFERLTRAETYKVTVHPQFAAAIRSALPGNKASAVEIDADPNCAPGTLVVQSKDGVIDASVDAQLDEIRRGLADRLLKA